MATQFILFVYLRRSNCLLDAHLGTNVVDDEAVGVSRDLGELLSRILALLAVEVEHSEELGISVLMYGLNDAGHPAFLLKFVDHTSHHVVARLKYEYICVQNIVNLKQKVFQKITGIDMVGRTER